MVCEDFTSCGFNPQTLPLSVFNANCCTLALCTPTNRNISHGGFKTNTNNNVELSRSAWVGEDRKNQMLGVEHRRAGPCRLYVVQHRSRSAVCDEWNSGWFHRPSEVFGRGSREDERGPCHASVTSTAQCISQDGPVTPVWRHNDDDLLIEHKLQAKKCGKSCVCIFQRKWTNIWPLICQNLKKHKILFS